MKRFSIVCYMLPFLFSFSFECCAENCILPEEKMHIALFDGPKSKLASWSKDSISFENKKFSNNDSHTKLRALSYDKGAGLPQQLSTDQTRFDVPYDTSGDNELLITSIHPDTLVLLPSEEVALISLFEHKVLRIIHPKKNVLSLSWSATSTYFALVLSKDMTARKIPNPLDILGKMLGHPFSYNDIYVAIYTKKGNFVCEQKIGHRLRNGRGYIVDWKE